MSLSSTKIGFVGTGTMSSAMVRGLSTLAQPPSQIIVSPRNADKAAALQQEFPSIVSSGTSNQDVLDRSDLVFLGVLPRLAEEVCSALQFDAHHTVISLISTAPLASLREWCAPSEVGRAIPLPPVALHKGATILSPPLPLSVQVFSALGTAVPVETEEQMKKMMPVTGLMGQFYAQQRSTQDWLKRQGIPEETAAACASLFIARESKHLCLATHHPRRRRPAFVLSCSRSCHPPCQPALTPQPQSPLRSHPPPHRSPS